MPTLYLTEEALRAINEVKSMFKADCGLDIDQSQAVVWLHANWKQIPIKMWIEDNIHSALYAEIQTTFVNEGAPGMGRMKSEGKIIDYSISTSIDGITLSVIPVGHIETHTVEMGVGVLKSE